MNERATGNHREVILFLADVYYRVITKRKELIPQIKFGCEGNFDMVNTPWVGLRGNDTRIKNGVISKEYKVRK